jgi:SAM-dependent methyltransferase
VDRRAAGRGRGARDAVRRRAEGRMIAALSADVLYGRLLASAAGGGTARARVRLADGRLEPLPLDRWLAPADDADAALLERVEGPVLDIGCGPGRHLAALQAAGKRALGVDLSPVAVQLARDRGAEAIAGNVFADVPGVWRTALLLDGNIGIGGAPAALLRRAGQLLSADGVVVAEVDPRGAPTFRTRIRIEAHDAVSDWFAWARVGLDGIEHVAAGAGFGLVAVLEIAGRTFVTLGR